MRFVFSTLVIVVMTFGQAAAQQNEQAAIDKQREAIKPLAWMDGVWRGDAWIILPTGERTCMRSERSFISRW